MKNSSDEGFIEIGIERKEFTGKSDTFVIPVGDVIMGGLKDNEGESCAVTQLWWINAERLPEVKALCDVWIKHGFSLRVGSSGEGSKDCPYIIAEEEQQRGHNMAYAASSRGVGAYVGDVLIWLDLVNPDKAYDYMLKHSDIPVAVQCDIHRYSSDDRYKQVFDIANGYFQYYFLYKKPKDLRSKLLSEKDVLERTYDV